MVQRSISRTGGIHVPKGTTAERPPQLDEIIRFNTDNKKYEGFFDSVWKDFLTTDSIPDNTLQLYKEKPITIITPSALGDNSIAIGNGATVNEQATGGIAFGTQSLVRHPNSIVQAGGRFASTGDAQIGTYLLRGHTVNALETEIFLDGTGGTQKLILPDDCTWFFNATIIGHRTDSNDGHAGYKIEGIIYRQSGVDTTTILGNPVISILAKTNNEWKVQVSADIINGALKFSCTGQTGQTIRWLAKVETTEVTN